MTRVWFYSKNTVIVGNPGNQKNFFLEKKVEPRKFFLEFFFLGGFGKPVSSWVLVRIKDKPHVSYHYPEPAINHFTPLYLPRNPPGVSWKPSVPWLDNPPTLLTTYCLSLTGFLKPELRRVISGGVPKPPRVVEAIRCP